MDSNNEYTHGWFWKDLSITMPPNFQQPNTTILLDYNSHATYVTEMRITVTEEEKLPF